MSDAPPLPPGFERNAPQAAPPMPPGFVRETAPAAPASPPNTRTGAPVNVRAAVGSAQTPEDRLATIRRFYPDAQPHGDGNFIFRHPRTGQPTLYNPPGPDFGDAASVIPEIGEFLGGTAGGAAAVMAAPATGGTSVAAIPAAVGLGAAAGREIATLGANLLGNTVDTRGPLQRLTDAGMTAATNAAALPIANLIGRGVGAVWGAMPRVMGPATGPAAVNDFVSAGVTPSAGAVTGNRATQLLEATLEATPGGAQPMSHLRALQAREMGAAVDTTAGNFGQATDPMRAGTTVREGAAAATERFKAQQKTLYDRAYNLIGADRPSGVAASQRLLQELQADLARAPESRAAVLQPVVRRLEALVNDAAANNGAVRFDALRDIRTDLGRQLAEPRGAATAPPSDTRVYLERLYGALSEDVGVAARQAGPAADRAMRTADRYTRMQRDQNLPALERVLSSRTDEEVFRLVFPPSGRPDPQALMRIRRNLTPEEWGAVQATVLERMGLPTAGTNAGETFSINTFLTNWNRLMTNGGNSRQALFGGGQNGPLAGELDQLVRVAQRLRDAGRMANFAGTARVFGMGAGALQAGTDIVEGDWKGLATLGAMGIIAPRYAAQMIANPAVVRWLAGATQHHALRHTIPDSQWARLLAVGEANPELRDAIDAFRAASIAAPAVSSRPTPGTPAAR